MAQMPILYGILFLILTHESKGATFGSFNLKEQDNENKTMSYQDLFYSRFMSTENDMSATSSMDDITTNVMISNSSSDSDGDIRYIKISSAIEIPETESIKLIFSALKVLWEAFLTSIKKGFMPSMERIRRDTSAVETSKGTIIYLNLTMSSVLG